MGIAHSKRGFFLYQGVPFFNIEIKPVPICAVPLL